MKKRPVYENMFEYLEEHYTFKSPTTPLTKFYKKDIYEYQYKHLDGPVNPKQVKFKNAKAAAELVFEFAKPAGADLIGFTYVKECFIFEGIKIK